MVNSRHDPHQTYKDLPLHHSDLRFSDRPFGVSNSEGGVSLDCAVQALGTVRHNQILMIQLSPESQLLFFENTSKFRFFFLVDGHQKNCVKKTGPPGVVFFFKPEVYANQPKEGRWHRLSPL